MQPGILLVNISQLSSVLGLYSRKSHRLTGLGIPIINLRRPKDRLRFAMGTAGISLETSMHCNDVSHWLGVPRLIPECERIFVGCTSILRCPHPSHCKTAGNVLTLAVRFSIKTYIYICIFYHIWALRWAGGRNPASRKIGTDPFILHSSYLHI